MSETNSISPELLKHLQSWVGRTECQDDAITAAPLRALAATLDQPAAPTAVLPPLWHWLYFLPHALHCEIGPDGHARRGGFLPPVPLPRRLWASGQIEWACSNPLRPGEAVNRESRVASVEAKQGRSGPMVFVKVEHRLRNAAGLALTEFHDIVYANRRHWGQRRRQPRARSRARPGSANGRPMK